jgi:NTP pyrophosphatase (non-canonical NTP hydrolase)
MEMNRLQQLMVITMEECGELIQECSKIIRTCDSIESVPQNRREALLDEAGDVLAMLQLLTHSHFFDYIQLEVSAKKKHEKLKVWSNLYDEEPIQDKRQLELFDL